MTESMAVTMEEADARAARPALTPSEKALAKVLATVLDASARGACVFDASPRDAASPPLTLLFLRGSLAMTGWLTEAEDAATERGAALLDRARKAGVLW